MDTNRLARVARDLARITSDLYVENAKLQELVRIAIKYCGSGTCDECPIQGDGGSCPYSHMASELGIEVDDEQHEL